jgi:hypothetical protein
MPRTNVRLALGTWSAGGALGQRILRDRPSDRRVPAPRIDSVGVREVFVDATVGQGGDAKAVGGDRTRSLLGGTEACFPLHLDRAA